eukprot:2263762-Rhodomonas_salina.1
MLLPGRAPFRSFCAPRFSSTGEAALHHAPRETTRVRLTRIGLCAVRYQPTQCRVLASDAVLACRNQLLKKRVRGTALSEEEGAAHGRGKAQDDHGQKFKLHGTLFEP